MTINLISTTLSVHHSQVEWDVLTHIITQFAYFDRTKITLLSSVYLNNTTGLVAELEKTRSYLVHLSDDLRPLIKQMFMRMPTDDSLYRIRQHLSKKGVLNFQELNKIARMIESAIFLKNNFPRLPLIEFETISGIDFRPLQKKFLGEFRHLVDETGEVFFERHPQLADLNQRLRGLEENIRRTLQEWLNHSANQKILQYASYDVHYDRYVVPIRSDSYRAELGLIVSRSETGQTLFVEPFEVRDLCNKRLELIAKIDEIINQLAMKFSYSLFDFADLLRDIQNNFLSLDHYLVKAEFADAYHLICPTIKPNPGFKFSNLFHPLLKNPVKNDAECLEKNHGIVISGPNTGGKTVFLKSLSLSYLLFYHGFFVPAAEAEMYPYQGLFYFGNDLQDLKTGLSSFSGEVKNYIDLMEHILPSNLILIDEIFNSTSSDEASALSLAYFDELHKKGICHIVVSTHHQMFKTLIHQDKEYISCHVGFDTARLRPTYKIQWGTPGSSMAIEVFKILAAKHDEVKDVPLKALNYLTTKNISYETLLQKVSQKQIDLDHLINSNRQLEIELKNQKGSMEGILNLKLTEELNKARKEVDKILSEARNLVEEARKQEITKLKKLDEKSHSLKVKLNQIAGIQEEVNESIEFGNININELKTGEIVFSNILKKEFTVLAIDVRKGEVQIGKGPIKFTVPAASLSSSNKKALTPKVSVSYQKNSNAHIEYDVRGMRLSETQNLIEKALGDLLSGDIPFLNVIHGHGDGVLKNWLRDYLKRSKDFRIEDDQKTNDGETRIILK
jgi:DNA mismatch repair protein MutS2